MSLINEALKKAQKMRQAEATPATPAAPPPPPADADPTPPPQPASAPSASFSSSPSEVRPPARIAKRRRPVSANHVVGAVIMIVVGFGVLAAGAVYFFIPSVEAPELVVRPAVVAASPVVTAPPATPENNGNAITAAAPVPATSPAAPSPSVATNAEPPAVAVNLGSPPQSTTTPAPEPTATTPPPRADLADAPPPEVQLRIPGRDPRLMAYVDSLRVAGVRPSNTDPRVLMSDRVYRLGDIVDRDLGLRLVKVESRRLTFEDANGTTYIKNF